jgi:hypothetical protein
MGLRVNTNRVGALLEYICSLMPHIHLRKLLKVVYLVDEKSVKMRLTSLFAQKRQTGKRFTLTHLTV